MLPNVVRTPWVVLLGELRRKHDRIQDLNVESCDIAGLTSGL